MMDRLSSWEPYTRSLFRILLAFTFSLHGYRKIFDLFPGGRGRGLLAALDGLPMPQVFGIVEIAAGALLLVGLFARPTAVVMCCEAVLAYFYAAAPRSPWPIRNGGEEVVLYFFAFLYLAVTGAGRWSLDELIHKRNSAITAPAGA